MYSNPLLSDLSYLVTRSPDIETLLLSNSFLFLYIVINAFLFEFLNASQTLAKSIGKYESPYITKNESLRSSDAFFKAPPVPNKLSGSSREYLIDTPYFFPSPYSLIICSETVATHT